MYSEESALPAMPAVVLLLGEPAGDRPEVVPAAEEPIAAAEQPVVRARVRVRARGASNVVFFMMFPFLSLYCGCR